MRAGMRQRPTISAQRPWRMLAISLVLSLLFGLAGMGEPLEDVLRVARNKANPVAASGDIVVITIDDASQREIGTWPWPRAVQAQMIDGLTDAGAREDRARRHLRIFRPTKRPIAQFADALERSGRVVAADQSARRRGRRHDQRSAPPTPIDRATCRARPDQLALQLSERRLARALRPDARRASLSQLRVDHGRRRTARRTAVPDQLSDRPRHHPAVSARPTSSRAAIRRRVARQDGHHRRDVGQYRRHFHHSRARRSGGVFVHVLGAETLKRGAPVDLGWLPMLLLVAPLVVWRRASPRARQQIADLRRRASC